MNIIQDQDFLKLLPHAETAEICHLLKEKNDLLQSDKKGVVRFRELWEGVRHLRARHLDLSGDVVEIGRKAEIAAADQALVHDVLRAFMPWRKGPFSIFDI